MFGSDGDVVTMLGEWDVARAAAAEGGGEVM